MDYAEDEMPEVVKCRVKYYENISKVLLPTFVSYIMPCQYENTSVLYDISISLDCTGLSTSCGLLPHEIHRLTITEILQAFVTVMDYRHDIIMLESC